MSANDRDLKATDRGMSWPSSVDLVAPTTPVLSAGLHGEHRPGAVPVAWGWLRHNSGGVDGSLPTATLSCGGVGDHIRDWHSMRDRDLLFEPWDSPEKVVEVSLGQPKATERLTYEKNLRRNRFAVCLPPGDLAEPSGAKRRCITPAASCRI